MTHPINMSVTPASLDICGAAERLVDVSLTITDRATQLYAEITDDFNPIHLDADFAAQTPMGGIIAHGTMSLNLIWQSLVQSLGPDATRLLELDVKFIRPVRLGDVVTASGMRLADNPAHYDVWVRRQTGEDVIVGTARAR